MVYCDNMVAVIKVNGKVMREIDNKVFLPFGSDYEIYLKNLASRRAKVKISVDGSDILSHNSLIMPANSETHLEGFLRSDGSVDKRFRFIQKTDKISQHRGDRVDDGIVRIEYWFEKPFEQAYFRRMTPTIYWADSYDLTFTPHRSSFGGGGTYQAMSQSSFTGPVAQAFNCQVDAAGITIKGGESNQSFGETSDIQTEYNSHVISLLLQGLNSKSQPVSKPLFAHDKIKCEVCGTINSSSHKFCHECSNNLT